MKKNTLFITLLLLYTGLVAQNNNTTPALTKDELLEKSKNQRNTGWLLMGTGTALTIAGGVVMIDALGNALVENSNNYNGNSNTADVMVVAGLVAIGGSIPLLISGHRNHKKAMAMTITNKNIQMLQGSGWSYRAYPALSFTIQLGRHQSRYH